MTVRGANFTFIHIPKTGGSTITWLLGNRFIDSQARKKHDRWIDGDVYGFVFSFVRNPWDRVLSLYGASRYWDTMTFPEFSEKILFSDSPRKGPLKTESFLRNQVDWISDNDGRIAVNMVGRYENFERDLTKIMSRIGAPVGTYSIPHINKSIHPKIEEAYTPELVDRIGEIYSRDIEIFGYKRPEV